ncbi:MAG: YihY/virulence factor BrkB family protein [Acidimicrobiia bacterium]|nr:YihY/virulence factor BrkB family protein [Acidimicrobiia bacterium]
MTTCSSSRAESPSSRQLALVPSLIAVVYIYGIFADASDVQVQLDRTAQGLDPDVRDLIVRQIESVVDRSRSGLTASAALAFMLALWSSSTAVRHTIAAVNVTYGEDETRGPVRVRLVSLLGAVIGMAFIVGGFFLAGLLPVTLQAFGVDENWRRALGVLRWPLLALAMCAACAVLYRQGPDRARARWAWVSWGAFVASALWLVGSAAFSAYASGFDRLSSASGALAAMIILLGWLFLTAFVVLLGAKTNAELERQTVSDTTDGQDAPRGLRGAAVADDVV